MTPQQLKRFNLLMSRSCLAENAARAGTSSEAVTPLPARAGRGTHGHELLWGGLVMGGVINLATYPVPVENGAVRVEHD